jgi:glycosyltransferase involved in cell wall biosynthesis
MNVSIVIPVYNEEDHIAACLQAIAEQSVTPYEVIVVDNNSTDNTVAIALQFPFVRVLHENRQGVIHARTTGFNAARGEIIGRIDADSHISGDWVKTVQQIFRGSRVDAVSGAVTYHDLPWRHISGKIELGFRQFVANQMGDEVFLYGANMAMRRSAWLQIRQNLCKQGELHEDFDLAIHASDSGAKVVFDRRLQAAVSLRRFDSPIKDFWKYAMLNPRTYTIHGRKSPVAMYLVIALVIMSYWALKLLHRSYDSQSQQFSLQKMLGSPAPRVNPATFVD